jgi:DNA repair exonuclease SbcCD ATPase subunit
MERSEQALAKAQDAMMRESFESAMKELGMDPSELGEMSSERMEQLSQMSEQELTSLESLLNQKMASLQKQLNEGKNEKGEPLSESEAADLKEQLENAKKQAQEIKLSKKAQEFMKRLTSHPKYKELMEIARELAKANQRAAQNPNQPSMTQEQIDEMNRKLEELADQLKNDEDLEAFLENLKESMKECEGQCDSAGLGLGLMGLIPQWGASGPGQDNFFRDIGQVPQSENEQDIKAGTDVKGVRGNRQEKGDETYMEIKGPASLGERSKTPYFKVMPKYRKQAEEAMNKDRIPKEHQKRVRDYFDSLNRGKP